MFSLWGDAQGTLRMVQHVPGHERQPSGSMLPTAEEMSEAGKASSDPVPGHYGGPVPNAPTGIGKTEPLDSHDSMPLSSVAMLSM